MKILEDLCANGHEWTPENTYRYKNGSRCCRQCKRDGMARRREQQKLRDGHLLKTIQRSTEAELMTLASKVRS